MSLSLFMIMNTRDKEMTDQPRLNHFDQKSNLTGNIYMIITCRSNHSQNKSYQFKVFLGSSNRDKFREHLLSDRSLNCFHLDHIELKKAAHR